jgi:hypothetical protein
MDKLFAVLSDKTEVKVKIKLSHYRLGRALGVPEG